MKKNDLKSYFNKKAEDLENELLGLKLDFVKTRLNIASGRESNLKKAKSIKKKISQIKTVLRLKKLSEKQSEK